MKITVNPTYYHSLQCQVSFHLMPVCTAQILVTSTTIWVWCNNLLLLWLVNYSLWCLNLKISIYGWLLEHCLQHGLKVQIVKSTVPFAQLPLDQWHSHNKGWASGFLQRFSQCCATLKFDLYICVCIQPQLMSTPHTLYITWFE